MQCDDLQTLIRPGQVMRSGQGITHRGYTHILKGQFLEELFISVKRYRKLRRLVVNGNYIARVDLIYDFNGLLAINCVHASYGNEQYIHIVYLLKLPFSDLRLPQITTMKDANSISFNQEHGVLATFIS